MLKDVYDPLTEYVNVFHDRFEDVAESTFSDLATEANVDVDANRQTCAEIYAKEDDLLSVKSSITKWTILCVLLWVGIGGCIAVAIFAYMQLEPWMFVAMGVYTVAALIYLFTKVHPRLKGLKGERDYLNECIESLHQDAWRQMEPLNRLYDWDVLTRMMSKTVPRLEFDRYFTTQRLADLRRTYGWDDSFNAERSVLYSHSGLINGNPFVFVRTRKMEMGSKTYYGSKTIHWTTQERGSDGKYHTVHHSETLTASVTAPFPEYYEKTRLIYGNTAAPDLIFYRTQSGLATRENSIKFKWKKHRLHRKARNLSGGDFAMMTNEEFEVAFDTSNRNNNQQYALLFTPLAQESMLKLLQDNQVGYGDDFNFFKKKMINTIESDHIQNLDLGLDPSVYKNFDFDKAKEEFYNINANYFRAIYFTLAPLLCVPLYQQMRPYEDIYGRDMKTHSAFWEHEALANFWGEQYFQHPDCVTNCILKTEESRTGREDGNDASIKVYAYGYRSERRLTLIAKWGGDGRMHDVPVYWDEYLPVTGEGHIQMHEDNEEMEFKSQGQRLEHIHDVVNKSHLSVYHRHIASKLS